MLTEGQIMPDDPLGQHLTELARASKVIFEVGVGSGKGSTHCLLQGMNDGGHTYVGLEGQKSQYGVAHANLYSTALWEKNRCQLFHAILHRGIRPYTHPLDRIQDREAWAREFQMVNDLGVPVLDDCNIPEQIDLLFLDGGEFTSDGDFLRLWPRSKMIVLDDCCFRKATKNVYALRSLLARDAGFTAIVEHFDNRNGWAILKRNESNNSLITHG